MHITLTDYYNKPLCNLDWGLHVGYDKGCHDGRMEYVKKLLNDKYGLSYTTQAGLKNIFKEDNNAEF